MTTKNKDEQVFVILHNIRSANNVGSIFRTADAVGIKKIYLCGFTPTPDHPGVIKTALGAEKYVAWEHHSQTWRLLERLRKSGIFVLALEQTPTSINFKKFKPKFPIAIVLGNEVGGLSPKILNHCQKAVEIPMKGRKESLNVAVAFGILIYSLDN